jgi:hypothetical protein
MVMALLAGCGSVLEPSGDLADALVVELPGYVAAAARPTPETLCDGDATGTGPTPPAFPAGLGEPAAVLYQTAPATLEAYAWRASAEASSAADGETAPESDDEAAQQFVDDATAAAEACAFELATESQSVEPWSGAGWEGVRIPRVVPGEQQVDRRLVRAGDVVLLVIMRADTDTPAVLAAEDDFLAAVADNLG